MCSAKNKQYKIIDRNEEMKMTNKQWQTIVAICITFTVVFSVIALMTMDLLFKRCDTLEEVLYNVMQTSSETSIDMMEYKQDYDRFVQTYKEEYNKLLVTIGEQKVIIEEQKIMIEELQAMQIAPVAEKPVINYDYDYVLRVVAAECRGESLEGQMAVAQCIRETSRVTGMTPEEVVKQVNPNGTRQYSLPTSAENVNDNVREACERVFINGESSVDEPIRYFYSIREGGYSKWHEESLTYVTTIGGHKFFKAK